MEMKRRLLVCALLLVCVFMDVLFHIVMDTTNITNTPNPYTHPPTCPINVDFPASTCPITTRDSRGFPSSPSSPPLPPACAGSVSSSHASASRCSPLRDGRAVTACVCACLCVIRASISRKGDHRPQTNLITKTHTKTPQTHLRRRRRPHRQPLHHACLPIHHPHPPTPLRRRAPEGVGPLASPTLRRRRRPRPDPPSSLATTGGLGCAAPGEPHAGGTGAEGGGECVLLLLLLRLLRRGPGRGLGWCCRVLKSRGGAGWRGGGVAAGGEGGVASTGAAAAAPEQGHERGVRVVVGLPVL